MRWMVLWMLGCGGGPSDEASPAAADPQAGTAEAQAASTEARSAGDGARVQRGSGFVYEGWVGEGRPVLTVQRELAITLADRPGGPGLHACVVPRGASITFERSVVRTERPGLVTLEAPRAIPPGATNFGPVPGLSREQQYADTDLAVPSSVGPAQRVEHLAYRAEGTCYYRVDGDVIVTMCFHEPAQDALTTWWVRTACDGGEGWLRVDALEGVEIGRQL